MTLLLLTDIKQNNTHKNFGLCSVLLIFYKQFLLQIAIQFTIAINR